MINYNTMLKLSLYSVYDSVINAFAAPFCAVNDKEATRIFAAGVNDKNTKLFQNPMDFSLHKIGDFDQEGGSVKPTTAPVRICLATEVQRKPETIPMFDEVPQLTQAELDYERENNPDFVNNHKEKA